MHASVSDAEYQLIDDLGELSCDPLGCVMYSFPWGEGELEGYAGPRPWQIDILQVIGDHLSGPDRFTPLQIAVASGHGIGKSALVGQIIHWAMSTCEDTRVIVTANTGDQLRTKTVPEVSKWFRLAINAHWWAVGSEAIKVKGGHEKTWRCDFLTWSLERTEAFAGLHNKGKRIVVICDEASAIPDKIKEVIEGALTDEDTEIIFLAFGNPTQNVGWFFRCFGAMRHRWITRQIDSRTVEGTNKAQIDKWVADYGEDSDFVRVRVRGVFPRAGTTQFISGEYVLHARQRSVEPSGWPILSVDVARFGDDQTVIGLRRGLNFTILEKLRGFDTFQTGQLVMRFMDEYKPRLTVIDGDGLGAGTVDAIRNLIPDWFIRNPNCRLHEFHGGERAHDATEYYNLRAEMWGTMREWLKSGDIPDDPELEAALTGPTYGFSNKNQIQLEKKDDMKKRGLASPDEADCLAMSFSRMPHMTTFKEKLVEAVSAAPNSTVAHMVHMKMMSQRKGKARFNGR